MKAKTLNLQKAVKTLPKTMSKPEIFHATWQILDNTLGSNFHSSVLSAKVHLECLHNFIGNCHPFQDGTAATHTRLINNVI